ncbi:MAG: hypothetical protein K2R98_23045 [Gemmataceae bacterium]|nr:hypothetical protein [Gemmataceae bacterium]
MPLLDHFHPPLSRTHPWRGFHGAWAVAMARLLNAGGLPPGYYAVPFFDRDGPIEIDLAAVERPGEPAIPGGSDFPQPWVPPEPELAVAVEWPDLDDAGVEVLSDEGDPWLAAAVELVSPRNKDRPQSRAAFTAKCAGYLRCGCGLVVVDVVTVRRADLRSELLGMLGGEPGPAGPAALSAVSYRPVGGAAGGRLLAWTESLRDGSPLPAVPLWLGGGKVVRLDLGASYEAACLDLGIRQAG